MNFLFLTLDAATNTTGTPNPMQSGLTSIIMLVAMVAIFYFFIMRPQKKKQKEEEKMRNNLQIGDEIVTIGGIHGKIKKIKDDNITIVSSTEKTAIEISRWAIKDVTMYVEDSKEGKKQAALDEEAEVVEEVEEK